MNIRVTNPVVMVAMIALFVLTACSNDDAPNGAETQAPHVATDTPTRQDNGEMRSATSPNPAPASAPAQQPIPSAAPQVEAESTPEPVVAEAEPDTTEATPGSAPTQHIVKGVVTQWAPLVLFVKPGDQIVFRQMLGHDTETIDGMIPEGAKTWKSKLGAEGFAVSPKVPGIYMYKCNPHVSLGMIGAIAVGDPPYANLAAIEAHPQNKGMIGRAIRKLKQALASQDGG